MTHPMRGRLSATMQAAIEREWGAMLCGQDQWDRVVIAVLRTLRDEACFGMSLNDAVAMVIDSILPEEKEQP